VSPRYSNSSPPSGAWSDEAAEASISPWVQWIVDMSPEDREALIERWRENGLLAKGARVFAEEDREIAESTMAAKIEALNDEEARP
jgi:hypothetical protein